MLRGGKRSSMVVGLLAVAACSSGSTNQDASGAGGAGGTADPCAPTYPGTLSTATLHGTGFDQWEQWEVWACFLPAQSFSSRCGTTVVAAGEFSVTESVCTGVGWDVTISKGDQSISCTVINTSAITPAVCRCASGCDAGVTMDAAAD